MTARWYIFVFSSVDRRNTTQFVRRKESPMPLRRIVFFGFVTLVLAGCLSGQSPNGTINGLVLDPTGGAIVGAEIRIANDATGVQYAGKTNDKVSTSLRTFRPAPI